MFFFNIKTSKKWEKIVSIVGTLDWIASLNNIRVIYVYTENETIIIQKMKLKFRANEYRMVSCCNGSIFGMLTLLWRFFLRFFCNLKLSFFFNFFLLLYIINVARFNSLYFLLGTLSKIFIWIVSSLLHHSFFIVRWYNLFLFLFLNGIVFVFLYTNIGYSTLCLFEDLSICKIFNYLRANGFHLALLCAQHKSIYINERKNYTKKIERKKSTTLNITHRK